MTVGELIVKISADTRDVDVALAGTSQKASIFGQTLASSLASSAIQKGISAITKGIKEIGIGSVQTGMEFDSAMSQVAATMGKTMSQMESEIGSTETAFGHFEGTLRDFAQFMGSNTAFSATEAAEALNYMALAGYDASESMEMLPNVLNLAAAGNMELARASDMVTDAQTALGLSFDETNTLVDQMAKTASTTNTSVSQLGDAILTIGGTANNMSGGINEINQVLGILADNGIKGSEAGTHLRNMLLKLASPTKEGADALNALGVEIFDAEGKMRAFSDVFPELNSALSNLTQEQKLQALSQIFNVRDVAAANALLETNADRWDEVATAIEGAEGAAQQMADTQLDNLEGDITLLKSAWEGLQIVISDQVAPAFRTFVQQVTSGLQEITTATKDGGLFAGLEVAASKVREFGGQVIEGLNQAAQAMMSFDWRSAVSTAMQNIVSFFKNDFSSFMDAGLGILQGIGEAIRQGAPEIGKALPQITSEIAGWFASHVGDFLDVGFAIVEGIGGAIGNAIIGLPGMFLDIGDKIMDSIYNSLGWDREVREEEVQGIKQHFSQAVNSGLEQSQDDLSVAAHGAAQYTMDEFGNAIPLYTESVRAGAEQASGAFGEGMSGMPGEVDTTFAEVNLATTKGLDMLEGQLNERTQTATATADANLRQLATMAGISYDELTGTTEEKMGYVTEAIGQGILNGNMEAETALRELNNILNVNWEDIKLAAEYAFGEEGITSSVLTAWTNIQTQTTTVWGEILASLQEIWNSITVGAQEAFNGQGISTAFQQMKANVDAGMNVIKAAFTSGWTTIKAATATSWAEMVQAVTTGTNNMKSACQTGFTAIRTITTTAWKAIQTATQSTWNQIRSLLTITWSNLRTHADTSFKQTAVVIRTAWMQVQTETISTWSVIQAFLIECVGQIKSAFTDEDWVGVGTSIIDGIRDGILSKAGELAEAAAEVCRSALAAAKAAIESASPSKLFRREVGQMITLGIALGIKDKGAEVNKNIEEVLKSAHDTAVKVRNQIADSLRNLESTLADEELKYQEEVNKRKAEEYERQLAELYEELGEAEEEEREKVQEKITKMEQDHQNELLNQEREYTRNKLQLHIDSLKDIQSAYETELKAIEDREASFVDKMREYGDLFKKIKDKETEEEYLQLENIRDQITVLEDYGNMLQQMKEKAIPDTLLSEILSMDIDDASMYMQELQNMTDEDFADYLAAWEEKQALTADIAKKFYEDQVNAVNESFTQKMMEGLSNMQAEMMGIGINAVEGMHDGLNQGLPGLIEAARNIAQSVIFAMKSEMGIASPSRVMREQVGKMISEGVAEGMIDGIPEVEGAAEEVENSINLDPSQMLMQMMKMFADAWGSSGFIPVWQNGFARLTAVISEWGIAALELFKQIINEIMQAFETADWHSVGLAITDGITRGINAGQSSVINAAVSAATAALRAAKSALGISSPSSVFREEVGLQISKGIALGITDGIKEVETAMQQATATIAETPFEITDSDAQSGLLSRGFTQINNIQSPIALDPSEVARQTRWQTQEMVLALNRG